MEKNEKVQIKIQEVKNIENRNMTENAKKYRKKKTYFFKLKKLTN